MTLDRRGARRLLLALAAFLLVLASARTSAAYAWMIRHEYTGCPQCHADPSGGGLLTAYGSGTGDLLLRTHYGGGNPEEEETKVGQFMFGAVPLPEWLLLGADGRLLYFAQKPGTAPVVTQFYHMQSDAEGQVTVDRFRVNGSLGFITQGGARAAALTHDDKVNLISRVHWAGVDLGEDKNWTVRAGRMNLPFGLRIIEHEAWVRKATRTNINDQQQHGVAVAYNGEGLRGEVMAVAGNLQLTPTDFRDRGYVGFVEFAPSTHVAGGFSSEVLHATRDVDLATPIWRQAHGVFGRAAPWKPLVISAEMDMLVLSQPPSAVLQGQEATRLGYAGLGQLDLEPITGVHVIGTGELLRDPSIAQGGPGYGVWGSLHWYFLPHLDVRGDAIYQSVPAGPARVGVTTFLLQGHIYL